MNRKSKILTNALENKKIKLPDEQLNSSLAASTDDNHIKVEKILVNGDTFD